MKTSKLLYIIIFCITALNVHAQIPGYQGKKFIVSYGVSGMPFTGNILLDEKRLDFNLRNSFRLEAVVSKNISVGLMYERTNDIINLKNRAIYDQNNFNGGGFTSAAHYKGTSYGAFAKLYKFNSFGSIAPLGSYYSAEIHLNDIEISDDGRFYNNGRTKLHTFSSATIVVGGGIQYIFFNNLTVDLSFNFGLNTTGLSSYSSYAEFEDKSFAPVFQKSEAKLFSDYLVFTRMNIGWLAF